MFQMQLSPLLILLSALKTARLVMSVILEDLAIVFILIAIKQTNNDESNESDYVVGFIGIEKAMIEMLFINPMFRGQGIGTILLDYAIQKYNPTFVDVNEQNKQAVGFYEQYGFIVTGRSETDAMGDPFPILHMQLRKDSRSN